MFRVLLAAPARLATVSCATACGVVAALAFCSLPTLAGEPKVIPIWPGAAPGSENWNYEEGIASVGANGAPRVVNVTRPTLTVFLPDAAAATGTGVVICPGGGFRWLAFDMEGTDLARYLNSIGVAAFVLKYRVARTGDSGAQDAATVAERVRAARPMAAADGLQAIRVTRARAAEWGVKPDRIGIIGFSAGGFVAVSAALHHDAESRPNFAAPIYAVTPEDVAPLADAPPLFLVHADDDRSVAPLEHSIRLYQAWKRAGVAAELHIYGKGGHGFGMRKAGLPSDTWYERFRDWLGQQGLLAAAR